MTATKPPPPHGSESRYQGAIGRPGCRCRKCTTGWSRAGQLRRLAHLEGRPPKLPAAPIGEHIRMLINSGMSLTRIAAKASVGRDTISEHARGKFPTILRDRAARILAVRPDDADENGLVNALGTRRRIQTLYAAGYSAYNIADHANGLTPRAIDYVLNGTRKSVTLATRDAVISAYQVLAPTPGDSPRSRNRAVTEGWAGPDYWDADDFDNPDFIPATTIKVTQAVIVAENAAWLLDSGLTRELAAARLGKSRFYIDRALREAAQREVVAA